MSGLTPEQIEARIFDVLRDSTCHCATQEDGLLHAIMCVRCDAQALAPVVVALIAEAVEEARGEDAKAVRALAYELIQPGRGMGTTFVSGVRAGAFEAGQQFKALGARIARGEVSP